VRTSWKETLKEFETAIFCQLTHLLTDRFFGFAKTEREVSLPPLKDFLKMFDFDVIILYNEEK